MSPENLLIIILITAKVYFNGRMKRKYKPWYKTHGLKHVTGFLAPADKSKLAKLAKAADKSLARYVSRLLEKHVRDLSDSPEK